jgi:hypothetical protein
LLCVMEHHIYCWRAVVVVDDDTFLHCCSADGD